MSYYKVEERVPVTGDPVGLYYYSGCLYIISAPGYCPVSYMFPQPEASMNAGVPIDAFLKAIAIAQNPDLARDLLR